MPRQIATTPMAGIRKRKRPRRRSDKVKGDLLYNIIGIKNGQAMATDRQQ
jgi:hypothetical protein